MYDFLGRQFYHVHVVSGVFAVVNTCTECPRLRIDFDRQKVLELFPPANRLELEGIEILGRGTKAGSQTAVNIRDRCTKLTIAIPTSMITSTQIAIFFLNDCVVPYGI